MGGRIGQDGVEERRQARMAKGLPAGQGEHPAAEFPGLGDAGQGGFGRQFQSAGRTRTKQAMGAGQIAVVGDVQPEFLEFPAVHAALTAQVRIGGAARQPVQKKRPGRVRQGPGTHGHKHRVPGGIGYEPIRTVGAQVHRRLFMYNPAPTGHIKRHGSPFLRRIRPARPGGARPLRAKSHSPWPRS